MDSWLLSFRNATMGSGSIKKWALTARSSKKPALLMAAAERGIHHFESPPSESASLATLPGCSKTSVLTALRIDSIPINQNQLSGTMACSPCAMQVDGEVFHENSSQALRSPARTSACSGPATTAPVATSTASGSGVAIPPHRCDTERGGAVIRYGPASQALSTEGGTGAA